MVRIIAEAGTNHAGSLENAEMMVRVAKDAGCDTVKFQHVDPNHFAPGDEFQGWNMREWFTKCRFTLDQWRVIMAECEEEDIGFLCTPQTIGDFNDLLELGIEEVKISSDNLGNESLLKWVYESRLSVILSTGMADESLVNKALKFMSREYFDRERDHLKITLLVCTSEYPCLPEAVNIRRIPEAYWLGSTWFKGDNDLLSGASAGPRERTFSIPHYYGFSDHTLGNTAAIMAVALGATVIEKHFKLCTATPESSWACHQEQLVDYVHAIRLAEKMLGSGEFK